MEAYLQRRLNAAPVQTGISLVFCLVNFPELFRMKRGQACIRHSSGRKREIRRCIKRPGIVFELNFCISGGREFIFLYFKNPCHIQAFPDIGVIKGYGRVFNIFCIVITIVIIAFCCKVFIIKYFFQNVFRYGIHIIICFIIVEGIGGNIINIHTYI